MNDLQARKRALLVRSEVYRQAFVAECANIQAATAWLPRMLQYARMVGPVLAVAAPVAGWFFGARGKRVVAPPPRKRNLLGKMIAGYRIARQVKPVWDGFRRSRAHS
jgi:hypothetical protein